MNKPVDDNDDYISFLVVPNESLVSDLDQSQIQESSRSDDAQSPSPVPLSATEYYRHNGAGGQLHTLLPPVLPPANVISNHNGGH